MGFLSLIALLWDWMSACWSSPLPLSSSMVSNCPQQPQPWKPSLKLAPPPLSVPALKKLDDGDAPSAWGEDAARQQYLLS